MSDQDDTIALNVAMMIEDAFCQSWVGGRTQRLAHIQTVVLDGIVASIEKREPGCAEKRLERVRWFAKTTMNPSYETEFKRGWKSCCEMVLAAIESPLK